MSRRATPAGKGDSAQPRWVVTPQEPGGVFRVTREHTTPNGTWRCELQIQMLGDSDRLVGVCISPARPGTGQYLTAAEWRRIPLMKLKAEAVAHLDGLDGRAAEIRLRRGRPPLEAVSEIWLGAVEEGKPPTKAVASRYGVHRSTASRWVKDARAAGALPGHE